MSVLAAEIQERLNDLLPAALGFAHPGAVAEAAPVGEDYWGVEIRERWRATMDEMPKSLTELTAQIRRRPDMYLGYPSVERLSAFLDGWCMGRNDSENGLLNDFTHFCAKRFKISGSQGWWTIIQFYGSSELGSWKLFEEMWDAYMAKRRPQKSSAASK